MVIVLALSSILPMALVLLQEKLTVITEIKIKVEPGSLSTLSSL